MDDVNEPKWQSVYWGNNYPRLEETRTKWDPEGVFYTGAMLGTVNQEVINGERLCGRS